MIKNQAISLVDRFVQNGGSPSLTEEERAVLEQFLDECDILARDQIATLPVEHRDTFEIRFSDDPSVNAEGGSVAGSVRLIFVTIGLINLILRTARTIRSNGPLPASARRIMFFLALGHELGHITYGHNEVDVEDGEIRAMEAHADFWAGMLLANNILADAPHSEIDERLTTSLLGTVLFYAAIGGQESDHYHSAPSRFLFSQAGFVSWVFENRYAHLTRLEKRIGLVQKLANDLIQCESMRATALTLLIEASRTTENISGTIENIHKYREKWENASTILASIKHLLSAAKTSK